MTADELDKFSAHLRIIGNSITNIAPIGTQLPLGERVHYSTLVMTHQALTELVRKERVAQSKAVDDV